MVGSHMNRPVVSFALPMCQFAITGDLHTEVCVV